MKIGGHFCFWEVMLAAAAEWLIWYLSTKMVTYQKYCHRCCTGLTKLLEIIMCYLSTKVVTPNTAPTLHWPNQNIVDHYYMRDSIGCSHDIYRTKWRT